MTFVNILRRKAAARAPKAALHRRIDRLLRHPDVERTCSRDGLRRIDALGWPAAAAATRIVDPNGDSPPRYLVHLDGHTIYDSAADDAAGAFASWRRMAEVRARIEQHPVDPSRMVIPADA